MEGTTEGRLEALEITMEGMKAESAALHRDLQQLMRMMGAQTNNHDGNSYGSQTSVNGDSRRRDEEIGGRGGDDHQGVQNNWRKKRVDLPTLERLEPHNWINREERFFDIQKVAEEDKVELVYISMEGSTSY